MTWVLIQKSQEVSWDDHQRVVAAIGETAPPGLLLYAAGEVDGRWQAVSVWTSEAAYQAFVEQRVLPTVAATLGGDVASSGPPPSESFDALQLFGEVVTYTR